MIRRIKEFTERAYRTACEHGFHDKELPVEHLMMLVVSEIGEMVEADRKNRHAVYDAVEYGDKHPEDVESDYFERCFKRDVKDTVEDELADVTIRLFDLCGTFGLEIEHFDNVDDLAANWQELFSDAMLTENAFALVQLCSDVCNDMSKIALSKCMGQILYFIHFWASHLNIDLVWHVENKLRYNEGREKLHGKKY